MLTWGNKSFQVQTVYWKCEELFDYNLHYSNYKQTVDGQLIKSKLYMVSCIIYYWELFIAIKYLVFLKLVIKGISPYEHIFE